MRQTKTIKGLTIEEMASVLGITYSTAHKRLQTAGIKPLLKVSIYPESALEAIRNVPGKGRPPKAKPEPEPEKPTKSPAKKAKK